MRSDAETNKDMNYFVLEQEKKKKYEHMNDVLRIQGENGNWNYDDYMLGMYNGMELMMSILEDRELAIRYCKPEDFLDKKHITLRKCITIDCAYNHADVCFLKDGAEADIDVSLCCKTNEYKGDPIDGSVKPVLELVNDNVNELIYTGRI